MTHEDVLALLRPSTPSIDPVVDLMARLVVERRAAEPRLAAAIITSTSAVADESLPRGALSEPDSGAVSYWLTPVKDTRDDTAEEYIAKLIGREHIYGFGEKTAARRRIKPGDWICFYANGNGVIAHARVASAPEHKPHPAIHDSEFYPWVFKVTNPVLYLDRPIVIDRDFRSQLEAFRGRDLDKPWAWYVQGTSRVTEKDFSLLTGRTVELGNTQP